MLGIPPVSLLRGRRFLKAGPAHRARTTHWHRTVWTVGILLGYSNAEKGGDQDEMGDFVFLEHLESRLVIFYQGKGSLCIRKLHQRPYLQGLA